MRKQAKSTPGTAPYEPPKVHTYTGDEIRATLGPALAVYNNPFNP